jgi:hypothetical protein
LNCITIRPRAACPSTGGLTPTQPAKIKIIVDTPLDNADTNRKLAELLTL